MDPFARCGVERGLALAACGRIGFDDTVGKLADAQSELDVGALGGSELSDFPVLVVLDDARADRALLRADASDLGFFDGSGHVIPHEIEQVGSPGGPPLIAWVRVPSLSTGTRIYAAYGSEPP